MFSFFVYTFALRFHISRITGYSLVHHLILQHLPRCDEHGCHWWLWVVAWVKDGQSEQWEPYLLQGNIHCNTGCLPTFLSFLHFLASCNADHGKTNRSSVWAGNNQTPVEKKNNLHRCRWVSCICRVCLTPSFLFSPWGHAFVAYPPTCCKRCAHACRPYRSFASAAPPKNENRRRTYTPKAARGFK